MIFINYQELYKKFKNFLEVKLYLITKYYLNLIVSNFNIIINFNNIISQV